LYPFRRRRSQPTLLVVRPDRDLPERTDDDGIRVLIINDHAGLRAGIEALLDAEPGMTLVGSVAAIAEAWGQVDAARPDVVVLDPDSSMADGLRLCLELQYRAGGPSVVVYSGYAERFLAAPVRIAQADVLVSKTAPVSELLDAIRLAAAGAATGPAVAADDLVAASARLLEQDLPVMQMLVGRTSLAAIAAELRLDERQVRDRALQIIDCFRPSRGGPT
jgi:DNA-binding NarL/FixJ family response regulator